MRPYHNQYSLDTINESKMLGRYQDYREFSPNSNVRVVHQRREDSESFVLELEDYLYPKEAYQPNSDHNSKTDGISFDISKMSMKGYVDDPYLPPFNSEISNYQTIQHAGLTPLQSSFTSSLGTPQSEGSNYWSSSPDNSGTEEFNTSEHTYLTLPSDSFALSYDVNSSETADHIILPSPYSQSNSFKFNKMVETVNGE